ITDEGQYASFALTEPGAGSDVAGLSTTAERKGDHYILHGDKCFITNASYANYFVVLAKEKGSENTFTAFIVDRDLDGVLIGKKEKKMGLRASNTASVTFEEVAVPIKKRIGNEGDGFKISMKAL